MNWFLSVKKDAELSEVGGVRFKKSLLHAKSITADISNNSLFFI